MLLKLHANRLSLSLFGGLGKGEGGTGVYEVCNTLAMQED